MPSGEIQNLAAQTEPGAERGAAEQHDHRLQRERHGRKRQRNADLRGDSRQHGHEQHRGGPDGRMRLRRAVTAASQQPCDGIIEALERG